MILRYLLSPFRILQLYYLELCFYGRAEALRTVTDPLTRANMELAQDQLLSEIMRLRRSLP